VILGEVLGRVWAERQHSGLDGRRLVLVRDLASDARHVAVDMLDAGTGTTVLVATDEAAAAATDLPWVDAAIVALVGGWDGAPT
jgi:ethanolamine utilization protein EutN